MEKENIFIALGQALFAVFGSCVRWLNNKDKKKQRLFILVSEAISAAFSGLLVYCIYSWLHLDVYIAFAIAGLIGHQGVKGIELLRKVIIRNSGVQGLDDQTEQENE